MRGGLGQPGTEPPTVSGGRGSTLHPGLTMPQPERPKSNRCQDILTGHRVASMPNDPNNIRRAQSFAFDWTRTGQDWRERTDLEAVGDTAALMAGVENLLQARVDAARRHGRTWQEIGDALGVSRQAAQQKYGARNES